MTTRRVYTFGWDGPTPADDDYEPTFIFTGGWFGQSFEITPVEPEDPTAVSREQKIPGLLTEYFAVGTGSTLSAGTRGVEGSDARVGEVVP